MPHSRYYTPRRGARKKKKGESMRSWISVAKNTNTDMAELGGGKE